MNREQRDNDGALFINDERQSERSPDYKGSATVNGQQFWVSGWNKTSRDGTKQFLSLSFQPKQAQQHRGGTRNPPPRQAPPPRRFQQPQGPQQGYSEEPPYTEEEALPFTNRTRGYDR